MLSVLVKLNFVEPFLLQIIRLLDWQRGASGRRLDDN